MLIPKEGISLADFSVNLRRLRKNAGLSQDALGEQLGVTRQTVSSWERGNSWPDLDMLVRISDALHTTPNELLYPPARKDKAAVEHLLDAKLFGRIGMVVFAVGFLWGLSAGSGAYSPAPDTVAWRFTLSRAALPWAVSFLTGMVFLGIQRILTLLGKLNAEDAL